MGFEVIGYASSILLVLTIAYQLNSQWRKGTSEGVSRGLFVGQLFASSGFVVYSATIGSALFVVTNALLALAALVGLGIVSVHRRGDRRRGPGSRAASGSAP